MKKRNWQNSIVAELLNNYEKKAPKCRHFLSCGGCSLLDFSYFEQLEVKKGKVIELFNGIKNEKLKIKNAEISGGSEYGYRTRMDYVVGEQGIGLRKKRKFDQIEYLEECHLIDNDIFQFLREVYRMGREVGLVPYDLNNHQGEWRYLSVRVNEKNEVMVMLVTKGSEIIREKIDELIEKVLSFKFQFSNKIKSIYHLINDELADINFGEVRKFWGDEFLKFEICDLIFSVGPNTFFQNNIGLLNGLIEKMVRYFDVDDRVLDLYCGVGTLSLPMAKKCNKVVGVEVVEESIKLADQNRKANGIENVDFVEVDITQIFNFQFSIFNKMQNVKSQISNDKMDDKFSVLVVDPPRKGLEKVAERLLECDFEKIIYMSCNPLTLVKDLQVLTKKWEIEEVTLWDLYPQTPHVESLVLMRKISSS